ncbi:MAG: hypothetical protein ACK56I_23750, partial [bacterium]
MHQLGGSVVQTGCQEVAAGGGGEDVHRTGKYYRVRFLKKYRTNEYCNKRFRISCKMLCVLFLQDMQIALN